MPTDSTEQSVEIPAGGVELVGALTVPADASGLVVFAHGSGSSRHRPRNNFVADELNDRGLATLLFDLLTEDEDRDTETRFDINLLVDRLLAASDWIETREDVGNLPLGYFGSSLARRPRCERPPRAETMSRLSSPVAVGWIWRATHSQM